MCLEVTWTLCINYILSNFVPTQNGYKLIELWNLFLLTYVFMKFRFDWGQTFYLHKIPNATVKTKKRFLELKRLRCILLLNLRHSPINFHSHPSTPHGYSQPHRGALFENTILRQMFIAHVFRNMLHAPQSLRSSLSLLVINLLLSYFCMTPTAWTFFHFFFHSTWENAHIVVATQKDGLRRSCCKRLPCWPSLQVHPFQHPAHNPESF